MIKKAYVSAYLLVLIIVCFINALTAQSDALAIPLQKLDQHIQSQLNQEKAVGCAVAVVYHGKIIFIKAYGFKKKGDKSPIGINTVFQLGSVSKPISASLVAILQKQNLLSVSNSVTSYYPHILSETTIKHLLSHTSGYNRTGWNSKIEAGQTRSQLLKQLTKSKQKIPGKTFDYHNLSYSLIEEIIAKTCQQSFKEAIYERLLKPLNMINTSVGYDDFELQQNRAWPHQEYECKWKPSKHYSHLYHKAVCASAGINSNIKDMATFLQLQMGEFPNILTTNDLDGFHAPITVAPDALRWFNQSSNAKSYYGQGWRIVDYNDGRLIFHGGMIKGFCNFLGFIQNKNIGIVILHNGESSFSFKTAMMFFDEFFKEK